MERMGHPTRTQTRSRRTRPRRAVCLAVVGALLLTACGTKRSAELAAAQDAERRNDAAVANAADGPGVTSEEVRIGFVVLQTEALQNALGFTLPDRGDFEAQIRAMVDELNANGGLGGRTVVPVLRDFEALTDTQATEEALCKAFTEDDKVFAVVMNGQFQDTVRSCYRQAETLMLDATIFPLDAESFEELAPYLWQPSYPDYGELNAAMVTSLADEGFFDDGTLGVVGIDNEQNRRIFEEQIQPALDDVGVEPVGVRWIDNSNSSTLQAGQDQAVLAFKGDDVDRLLVVGGQRLASFMMLTAQKQNWYPRFALSTWDSPDFGLRNYPDSMVGAMGVSVLPAYDVEDDQFDWPQTEGERRCLEILERTGDTFETRANAREALLYCDAVFLLEAGLSDLDPDEPFNAETFAAGVRERAGEFDTAAAWSADVSDSYSGGNGFRPLEYDADCNCMVLTGTVSTFG